MKERSEYVCTTKKCEKYFWEWYARKKVMCPGFQWKLTERARDRERERDIDIDRQLKTETGRVRYTYIKRGIIRGLRVGIIRVRDY